MVQITIMQLNSAQCRIVCLQRFTENYTVFGESAACVAALTPKTHYLARVT